MSRLLHVADVHLEAPFGGFGREAHTRQQEVLDAFRGLPEVARAHQAEALLIAGDLFDGPQPSESTVIAVRETVRRLTEDGVGVFAVPGNHDALAMNPTLYEEALSGATVFASPRFETVKARLGDSQVIVYGVAFDSAEVPDPLSTFEKLEEEGLHVVIMHGAVPGAPHWEGGSALRIPYEILASMDVDYIALGDHHRFRPPDEFTGQNAPACYPGSFAAVDLSEIGPKGAALVELNEGGSPRVELVTSGVREVFRAEPFDVSPFESEVAVADALGDSLPSSVVPVVTLAGEPTFPLEADRIQTRLEERFGSAAVEDRTRFFDPAWLEELAGENTIVGHIARLGLERVRSAASEEDRLAAEGGLRIALRLMEVS